MSAAQASIDASSHVLERKNFFPAENFTKIEDDIVAMILAEKGKKYSRENSAVEKTIKMLDDEVISKVEWSFKTDKQTLYDLRKLFSKCQNLRNTEQLKITLSEGVFNTQWNMLKKCKRAEGESNPRTFLASEAGRNKTWKQCLSVEASLLEDKEKECGEFNSVEEELLGMPARCKSETSGGYLKFITWNRDTYGELYRRYDKEMKECTEATSAHTVKKAECEQKKLMYTITKAGCDAQQHNIELNSCRRLEYTTSINKNYPSCYNPALSAYQRLVVLLRKKEVQRLDQWRSVQRIKCFLRVFAPKANEIAETIETCRAKTFHTDKYDLNYWDAPTKYDPLIVEPYACSVDYVSRYYTNKFDDKYAPATACRWCSAHRPTPPPTPELTPEPTPWPTPPPTAKPTPVPTKARGEGCKLKLYPQKNFGGTPLTIKFDETACADDPYCYGMWFVGQDANDKTKSWKAEGDQCKFCFYKHANYYDLLGSHLATEVKDNGPAIQQLSSVRILDMRYEQFCPLKKSG